MNTLSFIHPKADLLTALGHAHALISGKGHRGYHPAGCDGCLAVEQWSLVYLDRASVPPTQSIPQSGDEKEGTP